MTPPAKGFFPPLLARDRNEPHRTATQLELFFDLVVVIAIAAAAHGLAHEISAGHVGLGLLKFFLAFFAIWWPWNLFTWFASSFDSDDAAYRMNVMVMMVGVMMVAATIPMIFAGATTPYGFLGYVILRLASAVLWLRVGDSNPQLKKTAKRYAFGQIALQGLWAIGIFVHTPWSVAFISFMAISIFCELLVPWYAEQAAPTPWHRHHIIERFGLLNIIVLGEVLLGATRALEADISAGFNAPLYALAGCGMVLAFAMWWLYFCEADHLESIEIKRSFVWGYGHFVVFASGAAVGAGMELMVEALVSAGEAHGAAGHHVSVETAGFAIAIPLALYVLGLWLVRDRYQLRQFHGSVLLFFAVLIALSGFLPYPPFPAMVLLVMCLVMRLRVQAN
ncbi:MAG: low temperature requirement protein A [Cyanobacteria bacterium P01_F01_bin.53]